jgi:NAD(P)-dependent dehydrogenase (short-subunit alcohol dehydrogenase family)
MRSQVFGIRLWGRKGLLRRRKAIRCLDLKCRFRGGPFGLTSDGFEPHFGTNYLSHALLAKLLLPVLEETAKAYGEARVMSVASLAAEQAPTGGIVFNSLHTTQADLGLLTKWLDYDQSKLANILYTSKLAKRNPWLATGSVEPGTEWTILLSSQRF